MRRRLFSFSFLWLVLLSGKAPAEPWDMKGTIYGQSHVNLRPGPDLKRPPQAVLREGQQVIVEGEEESWYLISLPDGRRGYVNKALVRLLDEVSTKEPIPEANAIATEKAREKGSQVSPMRGFGGENIEARSLPIIGRALERVYWGIFLWVGGALCFFILGWICGGNYYLRRDRLKRTKLHF